MHGCVLLNICILARLTKPFLMFQITIITFQIISKMKSNYDWWKLDNDAGVACIKKLLKWKMRVRKRDATVVACMGLVETRCHTRG